MVTPGASDELGSQLASLFINNVNPGSGAKLHLCTVAPPLNRAMLKSMFTEPTFTGYASKTILSTDWVTSVGTDAHIFAQSPELEFRCTASGGADVVIGYFLCNPGDTKVLMAALFDNPVPMSLLNQVCRTEVAFGVPDILQPNTLGDGD